MEILDRYGTPIRWGARGVGCLIFLLLFSFVFLGENRFRNNRLLSELASRVEGLQHLPGSKQLAFYTDIGHAGGAGNGCDFFVGDIRCTSKTWSEVLLHYRGMTVPDVPLPMRGEAVEEETVRLRAVKEPIPIRISLFSDGRLDGSFGSDDLKSLSDFGVSADTCSGLTFLVAAESDGHVPHGDLRCM